MATGTSLETTWRVTALPFFQFARVPPEKEIGGKSGRGGGGGRPAFHCQHQAMKERHRWSDRSAQSVPDQPHSAAPHDATLLWPMRKKTSGVQPRCQATMFLLCWLSAYKTPYWWQTGQRLTPNTGQPVMLVEAQRFSKIPVKYKVPEVEKDLLFLSL